jgi:hypothetical protein
VLELLALAVALLHFTDSYEAIVSWITGHQTIVGNVVLIAVVIGAIALALRGKGD